VSAFRLPDFLIIGAQKSGTTWLKEQLRAHSEVYMPPKEVHYFDRVDHYTFGPEWYARHFEHGADRHLVGEKTPEYLYLSERADIPEGPRRVHDLLPNARLIAVLRDPVVRALSAINHLINKHHIAPIHSVDSLLLGRKRRVLPWPVIEMGMYHRQLAPFLELYGPEAILTLFYEDDVIEAPEATLNRVCDFLGIGREMHEGEIRKRPNRPRQSRVGLVVDHYVPVLSDLARGQEWRFAKYYPRLGEAARRKFHALYEPHNERLFELLGRRPASGWRFVPDGDDA